MSIACFRQSNKRDRIEIMKRRGNLSVLIRLVVSQWQVTIMSL